MKIVFLFQMNSAPAVRFLRNVNNGINDCIPAQKFDKLNVKAMKSIIIQIQFLYLIGSDQNRLEPDGTKQGKNCIYLFLTEIILV